MKLSEIFKRVVSREEQSLDSIANTPDYEIGEEQPTSVTAIGDDEWLHDTIERGEEEQEGQKEEEEKTNNFEPPRVALPEGYIYLDATEAAQLHAELLRELPQVHPLFGVPLETFAAFEDNQYILFRYRGNPTRFVLVHLTWTRKTEVNEHPPAIVFSGTFAEFLLREKTLKGLEPPA